MEKKLTVLIGLVVSLSLIIPFGIAQEPGDHVTVVKSIVNGDLWVPFETIVSWDLEIYVDTEDDLIDVVVYDGIGAEFDLVIDNDGVDDYIFSIDGVPQYLNGLDDEFYGDSGGVYWWQANQGKGASKNKGCATNIMWEIGELDDEDTSLEFTIVTKSWTTGNGLKTKQSFTSTCHHTLNDGPIVYYNISTTQYWVQGDPITVSAYSEEEDADSDGDGYYDLDEVEIYETDPCCPDSHPIFVSGFNSDRSRSPLDPTDYLYNELMDTSNFGWGGIVPCPITFLDFVETIETESLVDGDGNLLVDVFFAGLTATDLTTDEADELKAFLEAGGILYLAGNSLANEGPSYNPLFTALGWSDSYTTTISGSNGDSTSTPVSTPVTTGPFGTCGSLTSTPFRHISTSTATIVATGVDTSKCIIAEASVGSNGGYLSMMGDPLYFDMFVDPVGSYYDIDDLTYFLNLFALAS